MKFLGECPDSSCSQAPGFPGSGACLSVWQHPMPQDKPHCRCLDTRGLSSNCPPHSMVIWLVQSLIPGCQFWQKLFEHHCMQLRQLQLGLRGWLQSVPLMCPDQKNRYCHICRWSLCQMSGVRWGRMFLRRAWRPWTSSLSGLLLKDGHILLLPSP